jgi:predicted DNA-binding transcriptional regulator YafY
MEVSPEEIKKLMQSGYGIFGGEVKNWAKMKFSAERARWVQFEEWHHDQKGSLHKDGSYTLEIPYSDERELIADILRFGADVEVIEPKSLRTNVAAAIHKAAQLYA